MTVSVRFGGRDPWLGQLRLDSKDDPASNGYVYLAYASDGADQERELTKLRFWWVKCGPSQGDNYPGIDKDCHPASLDAIIAAARSSSATDVQTMRWVREPAPVDRPATPKVGK